MDTSKWKSILVPREIYEDIKATAKEEGRTISGQLRVIYESYNEKTPASSLKTTHTIKGNDAEPAAVDSKINRKPYNPKKDSRRRQSVYE